MKQDITLTIGMFFDGTGNNEANTETVLNAFTAEDHTLTIPEAEFHLTTCARERFNISGTQTVSYTNYYTYIH